MLLPIRHVGAKLADVERGERHFCAGQIPQRAVEHRTSAAQIAARLMVERDGQLHQALQMFFRG